MILKKCDFNTPYEVYTNTEYYIFNAEGSADYKIGFVCEKAISDLLLDKTLLLHSVVLSRTKGKCTKKNKIKETVKEIIKRKLDDGLVIYYNCSTERGMQKGRSEIFKKWFSEFSNGKYKLTTFENEKDNSFGGLLISINHPRHEDYLFHTKLLLTSLQIDKPADQRNNFNISTL